MFNGVCMSVYFLLEIVNAAALHYMDANLQILMLIILFIYSCLNKKLLDEVFNHSPKLPLYEI